MYIDTKQRHKTAPMVTACPSPNELSKHNPIWITDYRKLFRDYASCSGSKTHGNIFAFFLLFEVKCLCLCPNFNYPPTI